MSLNEFAALIFAGLTGAGGFAGIYKLLTLNSSNKFTNAKAKKADVEATTLFSKSLLDAVRSAQETANAATKQATRATKLAHMAQEEVAFLRRWIINQGLVPPEYVSQLERDEDDYSSNGDHPD